MSVIDSSVAVKWLVSEAGNEAAATLIGENLVAPDIILAEMANVGWKKWRRHEILAEQALALPSSAAEFLSLVPSAPLTDRALAIALELSHPVYDCYFLALAEVSSRDLITADARLKRSTVGTRFEGTVRLLEDLA